MVYERFGAIGRVIAEYKAGDKRIDPVPKVDKVAVQFDYETHAEVILFDK